MKVAKPFVAVATSMLLWSLAASAHHSSAMYDREKEVELSGVVTEFQWTNPHSWIELDVDGNGNKVHHSIEMGAIRSLTRTGWKARAVKPGEKITVFVHPTKSGKPGGLLIRAKLADGRVLEYQPG